MRSASFSPLTGRPQSGQSSVAGAVLPIINRKIRFLKMELYSFSYRVSGKLENCRWRSIPNFESITFLETAFHSHSILGMTTPLGSLAV